MYKKAFFPRVMGTEAKVPRMVVETKNKFPIVFVHGAFMLNVVLRMLNLPTVDAE